MRVTHQRLVVLAVAVAAVTLLLAAPVLSPAPTVSDSAYGYSLSFDTNATLQNVTLTVPLPAAVDGPSPVVEAIRTGRLEGPDAWQYQVVETARGPALEVRAGEVPAARRPDDRRYSSYLVGVRAPADHVIETARPDGREPTVGPVDGRRTRPCPNRAAPAPETTCYAFDARLFVSYDAPAAADVSFVVVHNGVNTYAGAGHEMYYERLQGGLDGPQDGWVEVDGFARVEGER